MKNRIVGNLFNYSSFSDYLFTAYYVPDIVLGIKDKW